MDWDDIVWRLKNEPEWLALVFLFVAVIAGGSYYYYQNYTAGTEAGEYFNRVFVQYIQANNTDDYEPVIQQLKRLANRYDDSESYEKIVYFLGKSYFKQGQYSEAIQQFLTITRRYPESFFYESSQLHAGYCFYQLGQLQSALEHFSQLDELDPENPLWAEAQWEKALVYKLNEDYEKARAVLKNILENSPSSDSYWSRRAREMLSELAA